MGSQTMSHPVEGKGVPVRLKGTSDRDIVMKVLAQGNDPAGTRA